MRSKYALESKVTNKDGFWFVSHFLLLKSMFDFRDIMFPFTFKPWTEDFPESK